MVDRDGCIEEELLIGLLDNRLSDRARADVEAHADECARCRTLVAECVRADRAATAGDPAHGSAAVAQVGRYQLREPLGSGGMATVYRAYDPELRRPVAVKMVSAAAAAEGAHRRERLLHEAQSLARISHRNVVRVFDVGLYPDGVFVAMELLAGSTLQVWLEEQRPSLRRILAVLLEIGRGLTAIHGVGLIHRDVKPGNVIIDGDDVPQLIDLGLARAPVAGESGSAVAEGALSPPLTQHGQVPGTPAYMAPEQYQGGPVTPRTDQFSFCVMAYEALCGRRPFAGDTLEELRDNVLAGTVLAPASRHRVPRRVWSALLRGLAADPAARFPSLEALLAALAPRSAWRTRVVSAIAVAGLLAGAVAWRAASPAESPPCRGDAAAVARVWGPHQRAALSDAFAATGVARATESAPRVASHIDGYAARWLDRSRAACEASRTGAQSPSMHDRRNACLDRRLARLATLLTELVEHADAGSIDRAVEATEKLADPAACDDPATAMEDRDVAEDRAFAADLDRLDSMIETAHHQRGLDLGSDILRRAETAGQIRIAAAAHHRLGVLYARVNDPAASQRELEAALGAAARAQDDALAARCWIELVEVRGVDQAHHDVGAALGLAAEAAILRAGNPVRLRAQLENNLGNLATSGGQYAEARDRHRKALALREQDSGSSGPAIATSLDNLGNALDGLGQLSEAREAHERALAIRRRELGDHHPYVAASLSNLAGTLRKLGQYQLALDHLEQALAVVRQTLGPRHIGAVLVLATMGRVLGDMARHDDARRRFTEALEIAQAGVPGHPVIHEVRARRGEVALAAGDLAAAHADLEAAVPAMQGADVEPESIAAARFALARTLRRMHRDPARARSLAIAARASYAAARSAADLATIDGWLGDEAREPAGGAR